MEVWKDISGYEGLYQVSNFGRVKSAKGLLHLNTNTYGYKHVTLSKNNVQKTAVVHRLVANAFIDNPFKMPQVNHRDGNKGNNNVNNLEWVTQEGNIRHSIKTGLRNTKKILMFDISNNLVKQFDSRFEIGEYLQRDVYQDLITRCCNRQRKTAYGYIWRYAE